MANPDLANIETYETPSGATRYRVQISVQGRRRNRSFETLQGALDWRDEMRGQRRGEHEPQRSRPRRLQRAKVMTVTALIRDIYWPGYARERLAERTRINYYNHVRRWIAPSPLGARDAARVDAEDIADWQEWCRDRGASASTIRTATKPLSGAYKFAARRPRSTGIAANPVSEWIAEPRQHHVRVYSPVVLEHVRQAILAGRGHKAIGQRAALLLSLMGLTGMRPAEARALQLADVGERTIQLRETKAKRPRSVPLLAPLKRDIQAYARLVGLSADEYLIGRGTTPMGFETWQNWRDRHYAPARNAVAELAADKDSRRRLNISAVALDEARAYDLCRHSFAALLLASHVSLGEIARRLGHSLDTTDRHYGTRMAEYAGERAVDPAAEIVRARKEVAAELRRRREIGLPVPAS